MKIAKESWIIAAIGLADLITTIVFIKHHGAQEANPLFKRYWEMGVLAFILAKLACLVGPLVILEWARRRNPRFVSFALRTAIAGYIVFYGIGFFRLNGPKAAASEVTLSPRSFYFSNRMYMLHARANWFRWHKRMDLSWGVRSSLAWKPMSEMLLRYSRTGKLPAIAPPPGAFSLPPMAFAPYFKHGDVAASH